jgi:hypothetical protein
VTFQRQPQARVIFDHGFTFGHLWQIWRGLVMRLALKITGKKRQILCRAKPAQFPKCRAAIKPKRGKSICLGQGPQRFLRQTRTTP